MPVSNADFPLNPTPKVITFDCYGTLVQWYEVLHRAIDALLADHEASEKSAVDILDSFSEIGRTLTAEQPHRLYKDILRIGFESAFGEHGVALGSADLDRIVTSVKSMGPHGEVPDALRWLRERYKLAIFTNSDDELIAPVISRIGVPFDYVITAEQAGAYKPSRQLFEYAYDRMGVSPHETVHVAMGMYWDMKARHELGLRAIWVNRRGEIGNPDWLPYVTVSNLEEAAALLLPTE